jgi:PAS domain S-box-containing protein
MQGVDRWLVDSLVVPATLHDVEGRFVHMNAAAERASGKSNAQLLGHPLTELLPREARGNVQAQFRRAVELGAPTDFETVFVDRAGTSVACASSSSRSETAMRSWALSLSLSTCASRLSSPSASGGSRD